jgi:hypothetical protein
MMSLSSSNLTVNGNLLFNSGYGSAAVGYGCRAWVNFNGTLTVAIRANGNVSSITDNGIGDYTVNFITAMPDANYAIAGISGDGGAGSTSISGTFIRAAGTFRFQVVDATGNSNQDCSEVYISIFR